EVCEIKLIFPHFLYQPARLFFIKLFLRPFNEGSDVTHTENTLGHPLGIKNIKRVELLAAADKFDRLLNSVFNRKGSATSCIAIKFCKNNSREIETVIECFRCVHCILAGHAVHHEKY